MDYFFSNEEPDNGGYITPDGLDMGFSKYDEPIVRYRCKDCGTIFSYESRNKPERCAYCNELNIEEIEDTSESSNPLVIPFKKNLDDAIKDYKSKVFVNPLVPLIFKKKTTLSCISSVYIPVNVTDIKISGRVKYLAGDKSNINKNGEHLVETKKYDVVNVVNFDYKNVMISPYSKIDLKTFNSVCKYDLSSCCDYNKSVVSDMYVIKDDLNPMDVSNTLKELIVKHSQKVIRSSIKHDLKKLVQDDTVVTGGNYKAVLVPIYLLTLRHKGKEYIYIMNGQSGISSSNINFGVMETVVFGIILFLLIFIVSFIIAYYF